MASAGGDFGLVLLAFLIIALVGSFLWAIRKVLDQNQAFNSQILEKMDEIVTGMKEYKTETCNLLDRHDQQAKVIKEDLRDLKTTLDNRPCINGHQ